MSGLPADSKEKNGRLLDMATEAATNFMSSHNLQFKLPAETTQQVARAFEEGRGKMKKMVGPLALAIGAKLIAIIPIFLGGLAILATKALVLAKIAFILAAGLGLQKFLGGGGAGLSLLGKVCVSKYNLTSFRRISFNSTNHLYFLIIDNWRRCTTSSSMASNR